jgi:hypothetical protein
VAVAFVTVDSCNSTITFIVVGMVAIYTQAPVAALTRLGAVKPALVTPAAVILVVDVDMVVVPT